jgi:hypothetical protein
MNLKHPVYLFIREEELKNYSPHYKGQIVTTINDTDIAKTRQQILEMAIDMDMAYFFMMDDDITISFRDEDLSSKYASRMETVIEKDIINKLLLECLQICSAEYPIVGLPLRQGSFSKKYMFEKNSMIIRFVCFHVPTLKKEGIRCDGLDDGVMEDYYVQLSLLNKGYRSLTNNRYAIDDPGTGYKGGCNATRTLEVQASSAKKLYALFPNHVELKMKTGGIWKEERLDCSIKWKAFLDKGELTYIPSEEASEKYGIKL